MPAPSQPLTAAKPTARSRITNHKDLLPDIDGRSIVARRYRDILSAIISDQGGLDQMSEARLQLIRRFSACAVLRRIYGRSAGQWRTNQYCRVQHARLHDGPRRKAHRHQSRCS